jgi:hypothetical protein
MEIVMANVVATLGPELTYASGTHEFSVSEDRRAFILTFSDFVTSVEDGQDPVQIRSFAASLPVYDAVDGQGLAISVGGFALTSARAFGYAMVSVNGQTKVLQFGPETDGDYVIDLEAQIGAVAECRISFVIEAERDTTESTTAATTTVGPSVSAELLPRANSPES